MGIDGRGLNGQKNIDLYVSRENDTRVYFHFMSLGIHRIPNRIPRARRSTLCQVVSIYCYNDWTVSNVNS